MSEEVLLHHVALQCSDREKTEIFFRKIFGMRKLKDYVLSKGLSDSIFGINRDVEVNVYEDGTTRFEVFIYKSSKKSSFEHICILVNSKQEFIERCKNYGIEPIEISKEGKDLLFVKDFSDNLFEVKER